MSRSHRKSPAAYIVLSRITGLHNVCPNEARLPSHTAAMHTPGLAVSRSVTDIIATSVAASTEHNAVYGKPADPNVAADIR